MIVYTKGKQLICECKSIQSAIDDNVDLNGGVFVGDDLSGIDFKNQPILFGIFRDTNLNNIKGYTNSHSIFAELIRRQPIDLFTQAEWAAIGKVLYKELCWESIRNHTPEMRGVFKKLFDLGWDEYLVEFNNGQ